MARQNMYPEITDDLTLRVEDLVVSVDEERKLDGVSLEIEQGEYVGIVGPSGSGKTLLASYVRGLTIGNKDPEAGAVYYNETSFYDQRAKVQSRLRGTLTGYVPQAANLIPGMSGAENITVPARMRKLPVDLKQVDQLADIFELSKETLDKKASVMSGGEKQRVSIIRALAHGPLAVLLDEPTAGLHSEMKAETNKLLTTLSEESNASIIVISHEETTAKRLIHMDGGRIVEPQVELNDKPLIGQEA